MPRIDLDKKLKDNTEVEMKWVEILDEKNKKRNKIIGVIYRHPRRKDDGFINALNHIFQQIRKENKQVIITGDFNYDL